jgi:hypothetical protein
MDPLLEIVDRKLFDRCTMGSLKFCGAFHLLCSGRIGRIEQVAVLLVGDALTQSIWKPFELFDGSQRQFDIHFRGELGPASARAAKGSTSRWVGIDHDDG